MTDQYLPLTHHAHMRCIERGIAPHLVAAVLAAPDITYPAPRRHGEGRKVSVSGDLIIVHSDVAVITAYWRSTFDLSISADSRPKPHGEKATLRPPDARHDT